MVTKKFKATCARLPTRQERQTSRDGFRRGVKVTLLRQCTPNPAYPNLPKGSRGVIQGIIVDTFNGNSCCVDWEGVGIWWVPHFYLSIKCNEFQTDCCDTCRQRFDCYTE